MNVIRNSFVRTILSLCFIAMISVGIYWIIRTVFVIQTIEIAGNGITVVVDEKKLSKNLLFFPSERIRMEILQENLLLGDVQFHKKFPHTLVIQPILRNPFAILKTPERTALVDTEGYVLEYGDQAKRLPTISFDHINMQKGQKISDSTALFSITLLREVSKLESVVSIQEHDESSVEVRTEKTRILFSEDADLPHAMTTLQTLIAGFRIKGTLPSVVDLRFDKPVVQF